MKSIISAYLEETPLASYLTSEVSELSFNGKDLYLNYVKKNRVKVNSEFDEIKAYEFIRHIADLSGKNFNNSYPILDVSFDNYRLNAIHHSVASKNNEGTTTFIIRQMYEGFKIKPNDSNLCDISVHRLLKKIIDANQSIIISGVTGSGKTELQKYLISLIPSYHRLIMIEDTYETHIKELVPNLDINIWIAKDNGKETYHENIQNLIRAGLRNNPDWLMLSEVRGEEMMDLLQTITSGLSIITTIHSKSAIDTPNRMLQLMANSKILNQEQLKQEIYSHLHVFVHMKKVYLKDGVKRFISEIAIIDYLDEEYFIQDIYRNDENNNKEFFSLNEKIATYLNINKDWYKGSE